MSRHETQRSLEGRMLWQQPGVIGAVARFWQRSYAPDYIGFLLLETAYALVMMYHLSMKNAN